jgi:F-box/leucine-rich repeat protein 10/11
LLLLLLLLLQVSAPNLVYKLDLATQAWPLQQQQQQDHTPAAAAAVPVPSCKRPRSVLLYTLCSPGGCYTDWHVDFGGSAVWYHMVQVRSKRHVVHSS